MLAKQTGLTRNQVHLYLYEKTVAHQDSYIVFIQ